MGLTMLLPVPGFALSIGNFIATSSSSGYIEISDFKQATYLDVLVELDSVSINYVLEQVSDDQVLINIYDSTLDKTESLIEVSVNSDFDRRTRSFAYRNDAVTTELTNDSQARQAYSAALRPALKQLIVPATASIDDNGSSSGEFRDGVLHINITKGRTSVGTAVEHLARANKLNVLILPGDRPVHNSVLVGPVTQFSDLYLSSDKLVEHVYIDRARKMVRIVGNKQISQSNPFDLQTADKIEPETTTNIGQLLKDIAMVNGYTALIYPGDADALLNTSVSWKGIKGSMIWLCWLAKAVAGSTSIEQTGLLERGRQDE